MAEGKGKGRGTGRGTGRGRGRGRGTGRGTGPVLGLVLMVSLVSCGYQAAVPLRSSLEVATVTTRVPHPEVAACLTSELRIGLESTSRHQNVREYRLEVEVVEASVEPGILSRRGDQIMSVDQEGELLVRARIIHSDRGVLWGPQHYQVRSRALLGQGADQSHEAASEAASRSCAALAQRVIDDVTFFLFESE